ncbi:MAG: Ldh family oxidoreductase [Nitrospinae bacterium]|nr:Ldh family oxidoreductase [Nitrospinota bacterium]
MPTFTAEKLEQITSQAFHAAGTPEEDARTVAQLMVWANLVGHDSHGVIHIPRYVGQIKEGLIVPGAKPEILKETPSAAMIDGHWNFGHVVAKKGMEIAIEKARKTTIACISLANLNHIGRVGAYPTMAAQAGMAGIACCSSGGAARLVAPFGGRKALLATNPIAMAFPSRLDGPILLDFASSASAAGKIRLYRNRGQLLPENWIIDKEGRPSTDPNDFYAGGALLPVGGDQGHKGYALAFLIEILGGILSRDGYAREGATRFSNGAFMIVIDINTFVPVSTLMEEIGDMTRFLKTSPPMAGVKEVLYPGEKEAKTERERHAKGIEVEDETWRQIKAVIREYNLEQALAPLP